MKSLNSMTTLIDSFAKIPHKEPEIKWCNEFNHIKISHYECGIGHDWECVELLNEIKEKNSKLIKCINYVHNHKGTIVVFVSPFTMSVEEASELYEIVEEDSNQCIELGELNAFNSDDDDVYNLIRHIRTEAEWVARYSHYKDLMKIYFKQVMVYNNKEFRFMTASDYISENNLTVSLPSLSQKAKIYSTLLELEIKSIPEPKWGKINLYNEQVMSIIYETGI